MSKMDKGKPKKPQPYIKNYRQVKNAVGGVNSHLQRRVHQLVIQYQNVSHENMYK